MGIKSKLLAAVGEIDVSDTGNEALVDILVAKIKEMERTIKALHGENGMERERLHMETEALHRERNELRRDPRYGAYGVYYFIGKDGNRFILDLQGGKVMNLIERFKKIDFPAQQVSPQEWGILESHENIKKK